MFLAGYLHTISCCKNSTKLHIKISCTYWTLDVSFYIFLFFYVVKLFLLYLSVDAVFLNLWNWYNILFLILFAL